MRQIIGKNINWFFRYYSITYNNRIYYNKFEINKLDDKGFFSIINSCYCGGMVDEQHSNCNYLPFNVHETMDVKLFNQEFGVELSSPGREIIMTFDESEISQGTVLSYFAYGEMQGKCD